MLKQAPGGNVKGRYLFALILTFFFIPFLLWFFVVPGCDDLDGLARPWQVVENRSWADGGTVEIHLMDANGLSLMVERVGSADVDSLKQKLRVTHYFGVIPFLRCDAPKNSRLEAAVKGVLEKWLGNHLTAEQEKILDRRDPGALDSISYNVFGTYHFISWINQRE